MYLRFCKTNINESEENIVVNQYGGISISINVAGKQPLDNVVPYLLFNVQF